MQRPYAELTDFPFWNAVKLCEVKIEVGIEAYHQDRNVSKLFSHWPITCMLAYFQSDSMRNFTQKVIKR